MWHIESVDIEETPSPAPISSISAPRGRGHKKARFDPSIQPYETVSAPVRLAKRVERLWPYYEQGAAEFKLGFIFSRRTKSNSQSYLVLDHSISHSTPEDAYSNTHANGRSVPSSSLCAFWRRTSRSRFTAYIRLMWNMLRRLKVACYRSRISEIDWSLVRYASFQHSVDLRVILISKPILVWSAKTPGLSDTP